MRAFGTIARTVALLICAALGACSATGVDIQTYSVSSASTTHTAVDQDGRLVSTIDLIVEAGTVRVIGAGLKYAVSAGDLSTATGVSGAEGRTSVTWTVTPAQYAGQTDLTFSVCADNQDPSVCTPAVLLTLHPPT